MPRYFFNVHDGEQYPDFVGQELADIDAARDEAVRYAGEMLRLEPSKFWNEGIWAMDVVDDAGLILFTLTFGVREQPASERQPYKRSPP